MPSKCTAVAALQKLEADRLPLAERQKEHEEQTALELGRIILGSGLESFSRMPVAMVGAAGRLSAEMLSAENAEITEKGRVFMIEHCGHWISEKQPDALCNAIVELKNEVGAFD